MQQKADMLKNKFPASAFLTSQLSPMYIYLSTPPYFAAGGIFQPVVNQQNITVRAIFSDTVNGALSL